MEDASSSRNANRSPLVIQAEQRRCLSRHDWIDKLKDSRCKWMVTLRRYTGSSSSSSFKTSSLEKLRKDNNRRTGPQYTPFNMNGSVAIPAADFCLGCASIVDVELEYIKNGGYVERRRPCSSCEHNKYPLRLASTNKVETLGSLWTASTDNDNGARQSLPFEKEDLVTYKHHDRVHLGLGNVPCGSSAAEETFNEKFTYHRYADSFLGVPEGGVREHAGKFRRLGLNRRGTRQARREAMLQGLTALKTRHQSHTSAPEIGLVEKQGTDTDKETICSPLIGLERDSMSNGAPYVSGEWAEEMRVKDELISNLKRQLVTLGEQPMEEIVTLEEAKKRLREAIDALMSGDASVEMEHALEKWDKYVTNHPDHIKEQAAEEQAWERENEPKNNEALRLMKTFVPPDIFHADLDGLRGGGLSPALAKRIFDRKVLWLVRAPQGMVSKTHVVELKSKFLANDLDVVESRALHACLPYKFENDSDGAKTGWRAGFRKRLKELLGKEDGGHLKPAEVRRPVYKGMAQGPFDPDAAAEEQETMRSSAFDASEKPVVGGKLEASKIAVIGEGLASKLKPGPTSERSMADLKKDSDREAVTIRSEPNSPASKYRRQSYALSRGQPTACSMKNMMSELGSRLSHRRQNQRRSSSFDGSQLVGGALCPILTLADSVVEKGDMPPKVDDLSSEESTSEAAMETLDVARTPLSIPTPPLNPSGIPTSSLRHMPTKRPAGNGAPPNMQDMMSELAERAKAREGRFALLSTSSPIVTPNPSRSARDERSPGRTQQDGCRESISPSSPSSPPSPSPPPPLLTSLPPPSKQQQPVSMEAMMAELEAKTRARGCRHAAES